MKAWAWVNPEKKICWHTVMPTKASAENLWCNAGEFAESLGDLFAMGYKLQKFEVIIAQE